MSDGGLRRGSWLRVEPGVDRLAPTPPEALQMRMPRSLRRRDYGDDCEEERRNNGALGESETRGSLSGGARLLFSLDVGE